MTSYKITEVDEVEQVVTVHVSFDDGLTKEELHRNPDGVTDVYVKRMMAPVADGADAVIAEIEGWLAVYEAGRSTPEERKRVDEVVALVDKPREFDRSKVAVAEVPVDVVEAPVVKGG